MSDITRLYAAGSTRARVVVHDGRIHTVATSPVKSNSMEEQTRETLRQIDARLAEVGSDKSRILSVSVFITDMSKKAEMNKAWDAWVDPVNPPQRACMCVQLEGYDMVEMVVVAATKD